MRIISFTLFTSVLIAGFTFLFSQDKVEPLRLIHADLLKREIVGHQIVQKLEGNVKFQQGSTTMKCDLATQFLGRSEAAMIGNVQIFDESKSLYADTVNFYQKERIQIAVGKVKSITDSDTTTADRMIYYEEHNKIVSQGNVRIISPKERRILTGGYAEYQRSEEYGKIFQNPVLMQFDSLGTEIMRIIADTIEIYDGGERTFMIGNVQIIKPGIKAKCGKAEYIDPAEKIILNENPQVWRSNQQISGDTLLLFLKDSKLIRAQVIGKALAISDADTLNRGRWVNKLTGQTMDFSFNNQKLEKVIVENQATSMYHIIEDGQYKGSNEVSGDKIMLFFSQGEVTRVLVNSEPEVSSGIYLPPHF